MKKIICIVLSLVTISLIPSCFEDDDKPIGNIYSEPEDGQQYVDLGLTSGTLWATTNIGASKPEDFGTYYAWGETEEKTNFGWSNYKYMPSGESTWKYINKYNGTDGLNKLQSADDVATAKWGSDWVIPTTEQWAELKKECNWKWTTSYNFSHIQGFIVSNKSNSDVHIFLPAAGYCTDTRLRYTSEYGSYWTLNKAGRLYDAQCFIFSSKAQTKSTNLRFLGYNIRAVKSK